ncbi:uncharacterized protein BT62DRAFT_1012413 [Guyanagaster necrorhizus]|uniref:Uncharacterized protein n=1 Tax=Guyanagaster necrorhizus TaxID=856835 RepID=A0A9P7VHG4_9AGAR|nr:uncharacterized protein BT62DRAFT_1012413 [Guyanagaster necrorhizus MCA 3950]KAG7440637.1 hypothetical protein BT62DRAFT_1012413 [Guyanagaster necrorhizus MCA 3950]
MGFESYISYLLFDIQCPTIGIVFSMIIIGVSRGQSRRDTTGARTKSIRWQRSTAEETVTNMEIGLPRIADTRTDNVEAHQEEFRSLRRDEARVNHIQTIISGDRPKDS